MLLRVFVYKGLAKIVFIGIMMENRYAMFWR